ncbi:MAG: hypothetical protein ACKVUT_18745 [Gaiella sp.]
MSSDADEKPLPRLFTNPRPVPGRFAAVVAGGLVIALALPVVLVAGWPVKGWALAAVLWAAGQVLAAVLARLPLDTGNLAAASMRGIGTSFRALLVGVPLVAVTIADERVGITAALVYALAYTLELAASLAGFFAHPGKEVKA